MGDQEESEDSMTMRILNPGLDHRKGREAGLERGENIQKGNGAGVPLDPRLCLLRGLIPTSPPPCKIPGKRV